MGFTWYQIARYKDTQVSHLCEKSKHTLCTVSEQLLHFMFQQTRICIYGPPLHIQR